jgi:basic membrane lipoprotein Med (substrate-binding protein (PBP1-ABC) superfamily)
MTLDDTDFVVRAASDLGEQQRDIVVISGGDSEVTAGFALDFTDPTYTIFIDIDQPFPCLTFDGRVDPTGTCAGRALPFNHEVVEFAVDQPAYLAGVIAASASRDDRLGIISGTPDCTTCNRYIEGFTLGARSVQPEIEIRVAHLSDDDEATAFGDPDTARTFAKAFIDVYRPDVLLPVAGASSKGVIEAACDEGILAIGTDFDVSAAYPSLDRCVLASITRDIDRAVKWSVWKYIDGEDLGHRVLEIGDGGVALTDEWDDLPILPVDTVERFGAALEGILSGRIDTCPTACGNGAEGSVEEPEPVEGDDEGRVPGDDEPEPID